MPVSDGAGGDGITGEREKQEEQEDNTGDWEDSCSDRSDNILSGQPDASIPLSTIPLLATALVSEPQSLTAVPDGTRSDCVARVASPAEELAITDRPHINIQDVTFLRVEGQRETPRGPEYLFVGEMWLQPAAVTLPGLVKALQERCRPTKPSRDPEASQAAKRRRSDGVNTDTSGQEGQADLVVDATGF